MRTRLIARAALSTLLITGMLVVKADDSETGGPWKQNYKLGTKQIITGYTYKYTYDPFSGTYYTTQVPVYTTINCCVQATDSDACNSGSADSRC